MKFKQFLQESADKAKELESWIVDNCDIFKITGTRDNIFYHAEDKKYFLSKPNHEDAWFADHQSGEVFPTIHTLLDSHGNLKPMYVKPEHVSITLLPTVKKIEFPSIFPAPHGSLDITLKQSKCTIDGFETFPATKTILIQHGSEITIKSLNGIDKIDGLTEFSISITDKVNLDSGVLKLAKCHDMELFYIDVFDDDQESKFEKLCNVIDENFKAGGGAVELQTALIDAGFEEYAKL